ncbi:MAG: GNAT family N-acetyltransferase [Candidatus Zipacnadales bacterium]
MAPEVTTYRLVLCAPLTAFLNEAYADLRALPRYWIEGPDYPEFTEVGVAQLATWGQIWVVLDQGDIIAAVGCGQSADNKEADIVFIATAPNRRREGHATRLLQYCEIHARSVGCNRIRTRSIVDSRYTPACAFFESCEYDVYAPDHMNVCYEIDIARWQPRVAMLPPGFRIRVFHEGDEQVWVNVHQAVFGGSATVEWFRDRFRDLPNFDPNGWFFALDPTGKPVGIAGAIVWFFDEGLTQPSGALVEWVGVLPEARGRGIGEALMVTCLNYLKQRNVRPNCLLTQYSRRSAVALYEKLGFRKIREHRTYVKVL